MRKLLNKEKSRILARIYISFVIFTTLISCHMESEITANYDVFTNGRIYSMDPEGRIHTTMIVKEGRIHAVGDADILDTLSGRYQETDLKNQFVFPGLIEGHGHFKSLGEVISGLDVAGMSSWADVLHKTEAYGKEYPEVEWIIGLGWHPNHWTELPEDMTEGYPSNESLSDLFPDRPVILWHSSMHALMANDRALEMAGVGPESRDPEGGRIVRDRQGKATGILEENAMSVLTTVYNDQLAQRTKEERWAESDRFLDSASQTCLSYGITTFVDAGINLDEFAQMQEYNKNGRSTVRVWAMLRGHEVWADEVPGSLPFHSKDDRLMVKAVKAFSDGALGANGAWMLEDYEDQPDWHGQNVTEMDRLKKIGERCMELGLQYCVHAIGDRANREVLDIFENIFEDYQKMDADLRWRIEHAQIVAPSDVIRFRELRVIPSMQAIHCTSDAPMVIPKLGRERAEERGYVWRNFLEEGLLIANGTDTPVESVDPFENLYASVTRKRTASAESFFPEQVMSRDEALRSLTIWNAYACHLEEEIGSLEPGKRADFMVIDTDLAECADEDILKAKVLQTYIDGVLLYERK